MDTKICGNCKRELSIDEFYFSNKDKNILSRMCKECTKKYNSNYYKNKEKNPNYYNDNKDKILSRNKKWRDKNPEYYKNRANLKHYKDVAKEWRDNNKDYRREYRKLYFKNRKSKDSGFKLLCNIRARQNHVLKGTHSTTKYLGCNYKELKIWIEQLFLEGMNWNNQWKPGKSPYNHWSIDHIIPLSSFIETQDIKILHFTNMRPLWHIDNILKSKNQFLN